MTRVGRVDAMSIGTAGAAAGGVKDVSPFFRGEVSSTGAVTDVAASSQNSADSVYRSP